MMKRILAAALAAAMAGSALAGCGGGGTSSSSAPAPAPKAEESAPADSGGETGGTLKFWTHQNAAWNESHQKHIDEFMEKNPGVTIEYENFPYSDFESKIQTSLMSDNGADIYELWGGWALDFTPTGALAKVPDDLVAKMGDDYYAPALGAFTLDGAYYGVPLEFNIEYGGMLVNKKLFGEKGLTYPATWAELEKIADETSVRNGEVMEMRGFEFVTSDSLTYLFLGMILSKGGAYLTENGYKVDFSSPEAVDAMTKLVDYVKNRGWTNLDGLGSSGTGGFGEVYKDACMMSIIGPWAVADGPVSYGLTYGEEYEYVALPKYGDQNAFAAETGWGLAVSEKSKAKELAWKYIEWFSQPENLVGHNIACSQIPPRKSIAEDPAYLSSLPYMQPILEILDGGQFIGYFNTEVFKEALYNTFTELVTTDTYATVADGLAAAQEKINALNA